MNAVEAITKLSRELTKHGDPAVRQELVRMMSSINKAVEKDVGTAIFERDMKERFEGHVPDFIRKGVAV